MLEAYMSIKFRLLLSYIGMILIPIILIILLNVTFTIFAEDEPDRVFNMLNPGRSIMKIIRKNNELVRQLNIAILDEETKFLETANIKKIEKELEAMYAGIILRKDKEIIYTSDVLKDKVDIEALPKFKEEFEKERYIKFHEGYIITSQMDFYFKDGSEVSLFILLDTELMLKDFNKDKNRTTFIHLFILILTTIALTLYIYKDINKAINQLKRATNEIKNGNLDFEIRKHLDDELGNLSDTLEEMRIKLKHSLEMQQKYEENRKNLISNISHDLKTPIMSIKGYIEGIQDGIADSPEKIDKYIHTVYEKAKDMEELIDELFLFSRLDLQKEDFNFQSIDLIEFLQYSVEDLSFNLEKIGGKIKLKAGEPIFVRVDLQKLKRVIVNIVENAIKYRKKEPLNIEIYVQQEEEAVVIEIRDNGKGISKENIPYIFDRFYRGDKSRNTAIVGSGLGLAISKQIIEKHGGKIWAESEKGIGTSIFFSLEKREDAHEKNTHY